jgi:hypothetical protein
MKMLIYTILTLTTTAVLTLMTLNFTTMKSLETAITIDASTKQVWQILMDHEKYGEWNPFIKQISGDASLGKSLSVTIQPDGKDPMKFTPAVLRNEQEVEFRWLGHLFVKGLFDGEHYFRLEDMGSNKTRLIHGEHFSGLMAGALLKMIGDNTRKGFDAMNLALKERVENN